MERTGIAAAVLGLALFIGCSSGGGGTDAGSGDAGSGPGTDSGTDSGTPADAGVPAAAGTDADIDGGNAEWSMGLPATDGLGTRRQYSIARAIIHLHNIYSHDACDGKPRNDDSSPNEVCHQQFRTALCTDHIDFAMMTDHYTFMAETDNFDDLYMPRTGDTWELEGTAHSANVVTCPDAHEVRIMVGLEGEASPVGIIRHPVEGDTAARTTAYQDTTAAGVQKLRDAGATPVVIHIEDRTDDWLNAIDVDFFETCNLHILLAPNIRSKVGLDPGAAAAAFSDWIYNPTLHPKASDLVFLEFHQRVPYYMDHWDQQLARRMMGGFAGNDAHQNVMVTPMPDGERPDSYRRMMKWYVNHLLVESRTGTAAREALHARRLYETFEVLGTPEDFDFYAEQAGGTTYEMGQTVPAGGAVTLRAPVPNALGVAPGLDTIRMTLHKISTTGAEVVYDGAGPVEYANAAPGRYRLEVFITPQHLKTVLRRDAATLLKEYPWIYSNPIEVQ